MNTPPLLALATAAQMVGLSAGDFRRMIGEDPVRVIQIGRTLFILTSDLAYWAEGRNIRLEVKPCRPEQSPS
jgi:hypothetical protein